MNTQYRFFFGFLILMISFFTLSACSNGIKGVAERPKVSIENVKMRNLSITKLQATAIFTVNIENPNSYPLKASGMDYNMKLNGTDVASGYYDKEIYLAAKEKRRLDLPVDLKLAEVASLVPKFLREKMMAYELGGAVHMPLFKVPFYKKGGLGLPDN